MATAKAANDDVEETELQSFFPHLATTSFDPNELSFDVSTIHPAWKRFLYELLECPASSAASFIIHGVITSLILTSAGVTILETIPSFHATSPRVWFGIETSLVVLFTVEYMARAVAWSGSTKMFMSWFVSFFGIIDLLAILPYYIEIMMGVDTSMMFRFSILRTFRLLRVFKAFRTNNTILLTIEVMYLSVRRSQHALLALGFFLLMFLVVFSTVLYFTERGTWDPILEIFLDEDGEASGFSSIPAAAWFVLVTITTVGYGDTIPRTVLGRLVAVPLLVCGLLLIALPSFVLGREFSAIWDEMGGEGGMERVFGADGDGGNGNVGYDGQRRRRRLSDLRRVTRQQELASQVVDLQGAVDAQGVLLRRLVNALEKRGDVTGVQAGLGDDDDDEMFVPTTTLSSSASSRRRGGNVIWAAPAEDSARSSTSTSVVQEADVSSLLSPASRASTVLKGKGRAFSPAKSSDAVHRIL